MENIKPTLRDNAILRWLVLLLGGIVIFVNYYMYSVLSPLKVILENQLGFTNTDFGLYLSVYSIPNTFFAMAVIGGIILDKIGIRKTGFMFVFFMAVGGFLTAYGASDYYSSGGLGYGLMSSFLKGYSPELKMMLLGRLLYGLGAETSIVVISKVLVKWFKGRNLALAFGLKIGFGRLGQMAALNVSPALAIGVTSLGLAAWFAAVLLGIGLIVFVVYMIFDLKLDKQINEDKLLTKPDKFKFSDVGTLLTNRTYIYVAILCLTFYSAVFPFQDFATDFLYSKFNFPITKGGFIVSLVPLSTAIVTPLFGIFIDKKGKSATVMLYGSIILFLVHFIFAFTNFTPYIPMIMLGIAFSLVPASMWPTVVKMVDESKIGTAYGLMYSIQNLGLWGFPILAGIILDKTNPGNPEIKNYFGAIIMFAILGFIGLVFAYLLKREDKKNNIGIELPLNKK